MKLEVGKTYKNKKGEIVTISRKRKGKLWDFVADNGFTYREDGVFARYESLEDLIEEIK